MSEYQPQDVYLRIEALPEKVKAKCPDCPLNCRRVELPDGLGSIKCYGVTQEDTTNRNPSNNGGSIVFFLEWNAKRIPYGGYWDTWCKPLDPEFISAWEDKAGCASFGVVEARLGIPAPFDPT